MGVSASARQAEMSSGGSPYVIPLPINSSADPDVLETEIRAISVTAVDIGHHNGQLANIETYNDFIPGPLLRVKKDDTVIVRFINLLEDQPTGIHWHGIELAN